MGVLPYRLPCATGKEKGHSVYILLWPYGAPCYGCAMLPVSCLLCLAPGVPSYKRKKSHDPIARYHGGIVPIMLGVIVPVWTTLYQYIDFCHSPKFVNLPCRSWRLCCGKLP